MLNSAVFREQQYCDCQLFKVSDPDLNFTQMSGRNLVLCTTATLFIIHNWEEGTNRTIRPNNIKKNVALRWYKKQTFHTEVLVADVISHTLLFHDKQAKRKS